MTWPLDRLWLHCADIFLVYKICPVPGSVTRYSKVSRAAPTASYTSVHPYSGVLKYVYNMYKEYCGIPMPGPNTFFSSNLLLIRREIMPQTWTLFKTRWGFWHFMTLDRSSPPKNTAQSDMWTIIRECVVAEILCFKISFKFYWSV